MISPRRLPIFDGHNDVLLRLYSGLNLSCRAQKFEIGHRGCEVIQETLIELSRFAADGAMTPFPHPPIAVA
jgi:hypothetical protein